MATKILTFPFTQGQDEDTTKQVLPMGKMRVASNVRQRHNGSMGQRPDYGAVAMTEYSGSTLVPYDIYNLNGRLVTLGDNNSIFYPHDIFEYVNKTQAAWRSTSGSDFDFRVPPVTNIRNIGQPPDGVSSIATVRCAAVNGQVCIVYSVAGSVGGLSSYIIVVDPTTDATLFFSVISLTNCKVIATGNSFWVIGVDSANDLIGYRIQTSVTTSLPSPTTLFTGTVTSQIFDACTITNTGTINQFCVFIKNAAGTTRIQRHNESGTVATFFAGPAVAADSLCIEADSTANHIVVGTRVGAADVNLTTYNLATNASIIGPTAIYGEAVTGDISIARERLGGAIVDVAAEDSSRVVRVASVVSSSHTTNLTQVHNCLLGGKASLVGDGSTILPLLGSTDNMLLFCVPAAGTLLPAASTDVGIASDAPVMVHLEAPGQVTKDYGTGKFYWSRLVVGTDGQTIPITSEFVYGDTARRQGCQIGNQLFLTGGVPLIYDGRQVSESGFLGRATFDGAIANNIGGSMTPSATYDYQVVWKWTDSQNLLVQSAVSEVKTHTMGGASTATTVTIFTPHTLRRDSTTGSTATVSLYRTVADGTTRGTVFHLTQSFFVPLANPLGASLTIFDDTSDADLITQPTLYTQGERGGLSGILEHNPPPPCQYCWPVGNRVFIGGLPNRSEVRISKALFPAEALAFSDDFAFSSFVDGDVTAVGSLDGTPIAFTKDEVFAFNNSLPDDNGSSSTSSGSSGLGEPVRIPSEGGCINPFSLVEVSFGLFYQSRDNKIMLLPRGGGSPVWAGAPIQDTLEAFPNIVGACYTDADHCILWACRNVALNDARIIVFDIKTGQWSVDTVTSLSPRSLTSYDGRAAFIDTTTVKLGSSSLTPSTFISYQMETGSHQPFSGNGWGKLISVTVSAEFRGNCRLQLRISYDDGVTWTTMTKVFSYATADGLVAGQTVTAQWFPARRKCSNYTLDFQVLDRSGAATAGLNLNEYTVELEGSFPQKIKTATAQRG